MIAFRSLTGLILSVCLLLVIFENNAYAYIDAGTGSIVLQVAMGLLFAGLLTAKRWGRYLVSRFKSKSSEDTGSDDDS